MLQSSANIWCTATLNIRKKNILVTLRRPVCPSHFADLEKPLCCHQLALCLFVLSTHVRLMMFSYLFSPLCLFAFVLFVCSLRLQCAEWHPLLALFVCLKIFSIGKPILILPPPHPPGVHILCRRTTQIVMQLFLSHVERRGMTVCMPRLLWCLIIIFVWRQPAVSAPGSKYAPGSLTQ